jgi:glucose/arabinose dehydrogenase
MNLQRLFFGLPLATALLAVASGAQISSQAVSFRNYFAPEDGSKSALRFDRPVQLTPYPDEDSAYVVVEQVGRLTTVQWTDTGWAKTVTATLSLPVVHNTSQIKCGAPTARTTSSGITAGLYESRGLLGFAFHPKFRENGRYYVSYVRAENSEEISVVAERFADTTRRPKTGDTEHRLITFCQPYWDHNGGQIHFGPDGYLYYASGDGGPQQYGDVNTTYLAINPAQDKGSWLGKMMRIDVNTVSGEKPYGIPADNPFVDSAGYLPEIFALGFRNPWKFTFHPVTGKIWIGDVGYVTREEISIVPKGGNMGWKYWEGDNCNILLKCDSADFVKPVHSLVHNSDGRSVTGGTFYFGDSTEPFRDTYLFGDYIFRRVWAAKVIGDSLADITEIGDIQNVVSFDRDPSGRIFVTSLGSGSVTSNTGAIYLVNFPKASGPEPVGLRRPRIARPDGTRFSWADVQRNPRNFEIRGLDGRRVRGELPPVFRVRKKGEREARLMTRLEAAE